MCGMMAFKRISISSSRNAWLLILLVSTLLLANNSHHHQVVAARPILGRVSSSSMHDHRSQGRLEERLMMKSKTHTARILRVFSRSDDPHKGNYGSPIPKR
ncbi:unnamed protein product [Linum trigynum]|uniref:Uncharacterized protein n=1 Tax=Linum trigynum TaxID=586398 RepID=A0AAV2CET1_9ROSI